MVELKEFLEQNSIVYKTVSNVDEHKYISSVSLGLNNFYGIAEPGSNEHFQNRMLKGHAAILEYSEIQEALNNKVYEVLPEIIIIIPEESNDGLLEEAKKFASKFKCSLVVYIESKISPRELYLLITEEISNQAQFMQKLLYSDYIDLAHLLTQDVEIGDIEVMAYKILKNPMIITDESFKVITYSKSIEINDPIWLTIVGNNYCPSNIVEMTDQNNFWKRLSRAGRPLFVDSEGFKPYVRRAVAEVRAGGKIRGYIALLEVNKPIKEQDLQMLQMVAELVGVKMAEKDAVSKALDQLEHEFISDLFSGVMPSEKMARSRAVSLGWKLSRWFAVFSVKPREKGVYIGTKLDSIKERLSYYFSFCVYSFNGKSAYYIISFEDKSRWKKILDREVKKIMVEENLICFSGLPVDTLMQVHESYEQAKKAAKFFEFLNGDLTKRSVYKFSELAVYDMLLELAKKADIKTMISQGLLKIMEIDEKEGTEYLKTLKCFFENNQNVGATADSMFVHRNTINYRLNKIRSIIDEDFDNPLMRLHLYISILIYEMNKG